MPHTLLLADDSVTIQRVIELTFADEDVRVLAVGDGRKAIERAQAERPDIVLADIGMPEMDGYEVAAFIKGTPELSHIPVLLLTGAFEPIDEGRARAVGCDGVLVKPFEPQMVISRVKDLIKSKRSARPEAESGGGPDAHANALRPAAPAMPPAAAPPASSDDYFKRLDAAFAAFDPSPEANRPQPGAVTAAPAVDAAAPEGPAVSALAAELSGWDPIDLDAVEADEPPAVPAAQPPATPAVGAAVGPAAATAPDHTSSSRVPLADAFTALLAAERGRPFEAPAAQAAASTDTFVDLVTRKVIERLGDQTMRDVILEVAERLVREEIDRIKSQAAVRTTQP